LASAEQALEAAQRTAADAAAAAREAEQRKAESKAAAEARAARPSPTFEGDLWLLARLATAQADAPVVVDARAVAGVRSLALLEKAAAARPVVLLGDESGVSDWAKGLGSRATVRSV
jgi:hypothetical protein